MGKDQKVFLITEDISKENLIIEDVNLKEDLYSVGTICKLLQIIKLPGGIFRILIEGISRGEIISQEKNEDFYLAEIVEIEEIINCEFSNIQQLAMIRSIKEMLTEYIAVNVKVNKNNIERIIKIDKLDVIIDQITENIPLDFTNKQAILEARSLKERGEILLIFLEEELEIFRVKNSLQIKVKQEVEKNQKDYYLREQIKVLKEELGEGDTDTQMNELLLRLEKKNPPKEVIEKAKSEAKRYKSISSSSEGSVVRNYIETLCDYPWSKFSKDNKNINSAAKILENDHYGLKEVKDRILEYLSVLCFTNQGDTPILCLVGPPGTGKTSIAKSIAKAVNKEYIRLSLGGVRDEAEIRGHRRTYVGAMPGRIVSLISRSGVNNPLFLLDEIDKTGKDSRGDTASALLEVLDSEQNNRFVDHYFEVPVDLSNVMFLATANDASQIPKPLLDRMEIIQVSSYTENEKIHIACEYLIGKQLKKNGLTKRQLNIDRGAVKEIVSSYTREAGVRELERNINRICMKTARILMEEKRKSLKVTQGNIEDLLGAKKYKKNMSDLQSEVGVVNGLAWTSVGGVTLRVEVNIMPGKGSLELTGQLGDVMKESAKAGISCIRTFDNKEYISKNYFEKHDIHIHIPEGAVPKDGPSAGITMATAVFSAITERKVRGNLAMTGEITLRGKVLPIGGLKEKLLAAKNFGITQVVVPKENESDVLELDTEITEGMTISYVTDLKQVLEIALEKN